MFSKYPFLDSPEPNVLSVMYCHVTKFWNMLPVSFFAFGHNFVAFVDHRFPPWICHISPLKAWTKFTASPSIIVFLAVKIGAKSMNSCGSFALLQTKGSIDANILDHALIAFALWLPRSQRIYLADSTAYQHFFLKNINISLSSKRLNLNTKYTASAPSEYVTCVIHRRKLPFHDSC